MLRLKALLIAAPVAAGLLAAPAAHAEWRGHGGGGGWHGGGGEWRGGGFRHDHDRGFGPGGVLLGLGAAAVIGGVIASQAYAPPPVYYAPPPAYYPPPPVYYSAPPGYYAPPPYYPPGY
jgi:hypothetical protein